MDKSSKIKKLKSEGYEKSLLIIILCFSVCYNKGYAQTKEKKTTIDTVSKRGKREIWIGAKFYPGITGSSFPSYGNEVDYERSIRYVLNFGFEAKIELSKKRFYLESGLLMMDWGYKEKEIDLLYNSPITYITEKNVYFTLPITLIYKYKLFYCGIGSHASYFIMRQKTVNGVISDDKSPYFSGAHPKNPNLDYWLFGLQAKLGFSFKVNTIFLVNSEFYSIVASPLTDRGFYNIGFGLGIEYKVK